jgi:hypothetical protein
MAYVRGHHSSRINMYSSIRDLYTSIPYVEQQLEYTYVHLTIVFICEHSSIILCIHDRGREDIHCHRWDGLATVSSIHDLFILPLLPRWIKLFHPRSYSSIYAWFPSVILIQDGFHPPSLADTIPFDNFSSTFWLPRLATIQVCMMWHSFI